MTTMPFVSDAWTMLPTSTWRRPMRPPTGAVIFVYDSCSFALSTLPRSACDRALVLAHERLLRVELLLGDRVLLDQRLVAVEVDARVREQRLVARVACPAACVTTTWNGAGRSRPAGRPP